MFTTFVLAHVLVLICVFHRSKCILCRWSRISREENEVKHHTTTTITWQNVHYIEFYIVHTSKLYIFTYIHFTCNYTWVLNICRIFTKLRLRRYIHNTEFVKITHRTSHYSDDWPNNRKKDKNDPTLVDFKAQVLLPHTYNYSYYNHIGMMIVFTWIVLCRVYLTSALVYEFDFRILCFSYKSTWYEFGRPPHYIQNKWTNKKTLMVVEQKYT